MRSNPLKIHGEYFQDILAQPQALENTRRGLKVTRTLEALARRVNNGKFHRIVLTGMGSSFYALHPFNVVLVSRGLIPVMVETSELVHYYPRLFDPRTLIIAVSQSGRSAETVRLLRTNRHRATLLGVTNTPNSPLARLADALVLTNAGQEFSVSCKTYVATLMALEWLAELLCGRDSRHARSDLALHGPAASSYLADWENHLRSLSKELSGVRHMFLVGRGPSLAAVGTGALIVKESTKFHAEGLSSAGFRHGPLEMLDREVYVLVFAGHSETKALNERLLKDVRQQTGKSALVGRESKLAAFRLPDVPDSILPVMEILPVQMITLALAARFGIEPGRFLYASKVTTTE